MRDRLLMVGAALSLLGCDSDCEEVCEAAHDCNIFVEFISFDCDELCDLEEDIADVKGCLPYYDRYYACLVDGRRDECLFLDPCTDERAAYDNCRSN